MNELPRMYLDRGAEPDVVLNEESNSVDQLNSAVEQRGSSQPTAANSFQVTYSTGEQHVASQPATLTFTMTPENEAQEWINPAPSTSALLQVHVVSDAPLTASQSLVLQRRRMSRSSHRNASSTPARIPMQRQVRNLKRKVVRLETKLRKSTADANRLSKEAEKWKKLHATVAEQLKEQASKMRAQDEKIVDTVAE